MAQKRYFEWIAGEDIGNVVVLESIEEVEGEIIYNFDDGETVNQRYISPVTDNLLDLKEKVMVEVENPSNVWRLEKVQPKIYKDTSMEEAVEVPTLEDVINAGGSSESVVNSNIGSNKLVPPSNKQRKRDLPRIEEYRVRPVDQPKAEAPIAITKEEYEEHNVVVQKNEPTVHPEPKSAAKHSFDPVVILVEKCKKHPTKIDLELTVDLPAKSMFAIAESEFEDGGQAFIDHVVSGIDTRIIIEELKLALAKAYGAVKQTDDSE